MKKILLLAFVLLLLPFLFSGCFASNMVKLSPDTYMIRVEDHAGIFAFNRGNLKSSAIQQANDFAASKDKVAIPIAMDYHPVGILGDWAAVEYQFRVVSKDDPEAQRTSLTPRPDVVIENNSNISADIKTKDQSDMTKDTYTELIKLDDLRKRGIITEEEFEAQKKKLLNGD
jgi:hypothetical protein